jgi:hypothetical protein
MKSKLLKSFITGPTFFITLAACSLLATNAFATAIVNGDFQTGDFNGWKKDTDGGGDFSTLNDFSIIGTPGDYSAQIEVDAFDLTGALDEVFFANTLYQELDLTAASTSTFLLSLDFAVDSEITSQNPNFIADYFFIGLNDGTGNYFDGAGAAGFLVDPTDVDGIFNYSLNFTLDNSFANQIGWFLDFQLLVGLDNTYYPDEFASTFLLHSASLTEVKATIVSVPEPGSAILFSFGLAGLLIHRRKRTR